MASGPGDKPDLKPDIFNPKEIWGTKNKEKVIM